MKFRKLQLVTLLLVSAFVFSGSSQVQVANAQDGFIDTNFEVWFFTQSGSRVTEAYALYIKQAYAPLGIDVKIVAKPFGQFVGDLLHFTTGHPFDLAQVRFVGGGPTPGFMWSYHSTQTSFGANMYQLNNPDWQAWQEIDTSVRTADVDALLEELEFELNLTRRAELTDEFSELYMSQLLYDFPMVSTEFRTAMWAGYGGDNNELWFSDEGIYSSIALGAGWEDRSPAERSGDNETLRLSQVNPNTITFDPMQGFDTATGAIVTPMSVNLLSFDFGFGAHPSIAYNYFNDDVVDYDIGNGTLQSVPFGNFTYYIRDDAVWPATTQADGTTVIATENVDATDFWFTHEIYQLENVILNGQELFLSVLGTEVSTTEFADDTLKVYIGNGTYTDGSLTPDDYFTFGALNAMPYHILGGQLTFTNTTNTWLGDMYELDALGINVQNTDEWLHWASLEGHSLVGPYDIDSLVEGEFRTYSERTDFFYPNEWDSAAHPSVHGGVFAAHQNTVNPAAFNWAWADQGGQEKPTSALITKVDHVIIEDTNARLLAFEAGSIDHFGSTSLGAQKVSDHVADARFVVKSIIPVRGPELLIFNLLHPDVKKLNVRKAMSAVLDKDQLVRIHDNFAAPHHSPVWSYQTAWYKPFPVESSYELARDLMRSEGYLALDSNEPEIDPIVPPVQDVTSIVEEQGSEVVTAVDETVNELVDEIQEELGSPYLIAISAMAVVSVSLIRRRRR